MSMSINNNYQAQMRYENNIGNQLKLEQMETAIKGPEVKAEKGFTGKDAVVKGGSKGAQAAALDRTGANINVEFGAVKFPGNMGSKLDAVGGELAVAIKNNDMDAASNTIQNNFANVMAECAGYMGSITGNSMDADINAIIQQVLRESYMDTNQDLKYYAAKVKSFNEQKKVVRNSLQEMRQAKTNASKSASKLEFTDPETGVKRSMTLADKGAADCIKNALKEIIGGDGKEGKLTSEQLGLLKDLGLSDYLDITAKDTGKVDENGDAIFEYSLKGINIETEEDFDNAISKMEETLSSIGDDAQLANTDLQNVMQKQQQYIQMMSNVSKMVHDTAMAIIRKIG